jgi:GcrA cell cycle regulator
MGLSSNQTSDVWTPEKIEALTRLWDDKGVTTAEIGRQIGVTKNAAIGKARRIGLTPRVVLVKKIQTTTGSAAMLSLRPDQCRYPFGHADEPSFRFCDEKQFTGSSYCEEHHVLCHVSSALFDDLSKRWSEARKLQHRARMLKVWRERRAA